MNATVNRRMSRCVVRVFRAKPFCHKCRLHEVMNMNLTVLSKVDDFATFKKVEVHAENSTF